MTKKHTDYAAAVVALIDNGCDCGAFPEEKGTCLACVCDRALREVETERDEALTRIRELERAEAEAMALVLSHESRIETLTDGLNDAANTIDGLLTQDIPHWTKEEMRRAIHDANSLLTPKGD